MDAPESPGDGGINNFFIKGKSLKSFIILQFNATPPVK